MTNINQKLITITETKIYARKADWRNELTSRYIIFTFIVGLMIPLNLTYFIKKV